MIETVNKLGVADRWVIDSAGTGDYHIGDLADPRMRSHATRRGLTLLHRARQVSESDFDDFDLIIAMDDSNLRNLRRLAPTVEAEEKVVPMAVFLPGGELEVKENEHLWCADRLERVSVYDHVPDPYYSGSEGFELVLDMLEVGCRNIASITR